MKFFSKPESVAAGTTDGSTSSSGRSYFQMMKPTIGMLVVVTAIPTLLMAGDTLPDPLVAFATLLGTFIASSSAGMFNHLADSDIDGTMERTRARPLPAGKVSVPIALALAAFLGILSFAILYFLTTPLAAWIAVMANGFYVLVYTMFLKRRTVQNIVIGGAAGAVGPLIGWAAVTGQVALPAWILFLVIFLWTPPHFWALAIRYRNDYSKARIPMLPSVQGVEVTRKQILIYTLTLIPTALSLYFLGYAGVVYGFFALILTGRFAWLAYRLFRERTEELAMPVFYFSLLYIFGIFGSLTFDRILALF